MEQDRYEHGREYAKECMRKRGILEMVRSIRIRFCSPGDVESATDFDRGVLDATLDVVQRYDEAQLR